MTQVKFYRVESLPEVGEVGSLYFVYGSGGVQSLLYICVGPGLFELYTPDLYELENKLDSLEDSVSEVETKIDEQVAKQGDNPEATNSKILDEVQNKLTPIEAVLTELNNGKQEMVDAIKAKGGNSNADKSLSEIANDVRAISNVDKTFNEVEYFMALYGLSMSPLQLIAKHFDTSYTTYVCYLVDADTKINVQRGAYVMFTADGAIENPEGEYTIPEWENRFGYFIFAYKSPAVTWEDYSAYFIGIYGGEITLDSRTMTKLEGVECDACSIILSDRCFASRASFFEPHQSEVKFEGAGHFNSSRIQTLHIPNLKTKTGWSGNYASPRIICFENLESVSSSGLRFENVVKANLNRLKFINSQGLFYATSLVEAYLPSLESASGGDCIAYCAKLTRVCAPNSTRLSGGNIFGQCPLLIDIECGEISESTSWNQWNPTSVLSDEEQIPILDKNIREHVAAKIKDLTGGTPQTFTFHQNVRNIMSEETENVFKAKNWNIAPTKSV